MRYLIFLILTGFTGVTAWGQASTAARPMAVNDTLAEDSTYALQEVVVRTSPVKRKADRFIPSLLHRTKTESNSFNKRPEYGCPTSGFPSMVLPARRCLLIIGR